MSLDEVDYKILTALSKNPLGRINELSKQAEVSDKTFRQRFSKLIENKIFLGVSAQICYPTLSLDPILIFANAKFRNIGILEDMCDLHPYTRYRIRCLGAVNGLIMFFAVPTGSYSLLFELLDELCDRGLIINYTYSIPIGKCICVEHDFSYYDVENDSWSFNWADWEDYLSSMNPPPKIEECPPSILHKMDDRDMLILRYLTINARVKLKYLSRKCNVPIYHLSRRIKFYRRSGVIDSFRVIISSKASRLFDLFHFKCKCSVKVTAKFAKAILKIPFQATLIPLTDGFMLQIFLPPSNISSIGEILQKYCDDVQFIWGDYKSSKRYWFYHEPFVNGKWLSSREYMVDNVLKELFME